MRRLLYILSIFATLAATNGFAENPSNGPVPDASAEIALSEMGELPLAVPVEADKTNLLYLKLPNGQNYLLPDDPLTPSQKETFSLMTEADREAFRAHRLEYLQMLLKVIDKARYPAGFAAAGWDKVAALYRKAFKGATGEQDIDKPTMGERGRRAIQYALRLADSQLWDKAPVVANSNEVGLTLEFGAGGGVAVGKYGLYGTTGFGFGFNLDRKNKFVSFEFYQDVEILEKAIPFTAGVAVYGALLGNLNHNDWEAPSRITRGEGLSGVGPVMGTFTSDSLRAGFGLGVGISPPIVSDLVVIETKLARVPWFKIGVSPYAPGYVRVKSGAVPAVRALASGVVSAPKKLFQMVKSGCFGLFSLVQPVPAGSDARWFGN